MALTKNILNDKIEISENGIIHVRQRTDIVEDGVSISSSYHRWTLAPGQDTTGQDARVIAIANATWTTEVISAYQAQVANSAPHIA